MDNAELIEALEAAGHTDQARQIRDRQLAEQLKAAGHESLATQLEGGPTAPAEAVRATTPEQAHGQVVARTIARDTGRSELAPDDQKFLDQIKAANSGWTDVPVE